VANGDSCSIFRKKRRPRKSKIDIVIAEWVQISKIRAPTSLGFDEKLLAFFRLLTRTLTRARARTTFANVLREFCSRDERIMRVAKRSSGSRCEILDVGRDIALTGAAFF
jgi:hypothetical protein